MPGPFLSCGVLARFSTSTWQSFASCAPYTCRSCVTLYSLLKLHTFTKWNVTQKLALNEIAINRRVRCLKCNRKESKTTKLFTEYVISDSMSTLITKLQIHADPLTKVVSRAFRVRAEIRNHFEAWCESSWHLVTAGEFWGPPCKGLSLYRA